MKRLGILLALGLIIFGIDLLSKWYVHAHLPEISTAPSIYPYGGIAIFYNWHGIDFSINYAKNTGAAWSLFSSYQHLLLYVRIAMIGGLLSYLFFVKNSFFRKIAFTLIVTGAIGNVTDYFIYGSVVDLFHFVLWGYSYPIFNIADSAIFCGASLLLLQSLFRKKTPQHESIS